MTTPPRQQPRVYLDWNASAPLSGAAREAMAAHLAEAPRAGLNPSSQHAEGRAARAKLEAARRDVAMLVGAEPAELVFTSGATEAANMALRGGGWERILVSAIEHDCVLGAAEAAAGGGAVVERIPVAAAGVVDLAALERMLAEEPADRRTLVAVMAANNETGALQPATEAVRLAQAAGASSLVDAAQAAAKTAFDFHEVGADFAILSAHKIGGPTGVGALVLREGLSVAPVSAGGGQEGRRRPGTENLLGAVGFSAAARSVGDWSGLSALRNLLEMRLKNGAEGLVFCAEAVNRLSNTSCILAPGWRAETQLMRLDLAGFAVSAGSACSSGKMAPSHVLRAMGFDADQAACAIRVSLGPDTAREEIEAFAAAWLALYASRR